MSSVVELFELPTSDPGVNIVGRSRGFGPPLLLLHGNPLTQMSWDRIAPRLAESFTVITTDLRGYGDSSKPEGLPDHSNYSFRRMALDQVEVMSQLGFERFGLVGHDRGARTAFRLAMDYPDKVIGLALMDILPTYTVFQNIQVQMAMDLYHWWFMAQPKGFPETLLRGNEDFYIRNKLMKQGPGKGGFSEAEILEYIRVCTPENIHGVCEDYRAAFTVDLPMDTADLEAGRKVKPPTLIIWGAQSHTALHHNPRIEWPKFCEHIKRMVELPCGHYPTEQAPEETFQELNTFFGSLKGV